MGDYRLHLVLASEYLANLQDFQVLHHKEEILFHYLYIQLHSIAELNHLADTKQAYFRQEYWNQDFPAHLPLVASHF